MTFYFGTTLALLWIVSLYAVYRRAWTRGHRAARITIVRPVRRRARW
jgi:hypothetical protein